MRLFLIVYSIISVFPYIDKILNKMSDFDTGLTITQEINELLIEKSDISKVMSGSKIDRTENTLQLQGQSFSL